jgi:hypothetical protein
VGAQMMRRRELGLGGFVRPYLRRKKVRSVLSVDDPLPALASVGYLRSRVA